MNKHQPIAAAQGQQSHPRNFIDLNLLDAKVLRRLIDNAHAMKQAGRITPAELLPADIAGRVLMMIFEKPSTRTRVSFDVAMRQLGGQSIVLNNTDLQLGRGETIADTARVLSRYIDAVMVRVNSHQTLMEFAANASVPIINGLTDLSHPCQVAADIMTFEESRGPIEGRKIAWVGDGNNVANSWIHAAVLLGIDFQIACPDEMAPAADVLSWAASQGHPIPVTSDLAAVVSGAECVVTDTWVSMGQKDAAHRRKVFAPYAVTSQLMQQAAPDAIFMHCLPAYRGDEVTADVIDGPQSVVFDEAENRLHAQKAILSWCLGGE